MVARLFENRFLVSIGRVSYGIYIYHLAFSYVFGLLLARIAGNGLAGGAGRGLVGGAGEGGSGGGFVGGIFLQVASMLVYTATLYFIAWLSYRWLEREIFTGWKKILLWHRHAP